MFMKNKTLDVSKMAATDSLLGRVNGCLQASILIPSGASEWFGTPHAVVT